MNPLANEEVELANCEIGWYKILLLVKVTDSRFRRLLYDHLQLLVSFFITTNKKIALNLAVSSSHEFLDYIIYNMNQHTQTDR